MAGYLIGGRLVAGGGFDAGAITVRAIIPASASVELPLNTDGSIDVTVNLPLVDPISKSRVNLAELLVPGRDFIGWVENDTILEAGPIWGDPFNFPRGDRIVANGLWSYFDRRVVLPVLTAGQLPRDVTSKWTGLSLGTLAKRLVQQAIAHPGAALPIDFPDDVAGTHEREYPGSDLKGVGDALRDLTQVENGPDIAFRPRWGADRHHVRWDMLIGTPELKQGGADHYWDVSVPDAHATVTSLDRDGSQLTSREFQTGKTLRNLMPNSTLEEELGNWIAGGANGTLIRVAGHASSPVPGVTTGTYTTWTGASGDGQGGAYARTGNSSPYLTVEPLKTYRMSLWARANVAKTVRLNTQVFTDDGELISGGMPLVTTTLAANVWKRITAVFTVPAEGVRLGPFLYAAPGSQWASGNHLYTLAWSVTEGASDVPWAKESIQIQAVADLDVLTDAGFPLLETVTGRESVVLDTTLQAYANEAVLRGSAHIETFTIVARRNKFPKLGTYWPGDYAKVRIGKNPRIPADTYRVRIIQLSFQKNGEVSIECAPERIVSGYPVPSTDRTWLRDRLRDLGKRIAETTRGT